MEINDIKVVLEKTLKPKRFKHSLGVMETAISLARNFGENTTEAELAGLLHDCARDIKTDEAFGLCRKFGIEIDEVSRQQPELLHGSLGRKLALELYGVESKQVLEAIEVHTLGRPGMGKLSKIIFVADNIEPGRVFPEVENIRKAASENLDMAVLLSMDSAIKYVISKQAMIHPDSIVARNWILRCINEEKQ
jgi:putative HD superfamily hydrolase of NAD metabolism